MATISRRTVNCTLLNRMMASQRCRSCDLLQPRHDSVRTADPCTSADRPAEWAHDNRESAAARSVGVGLDGRLECPAGDPHLTGSEPGLLSTVQAVVALDRQPRDEPDPIHEPANNGGVAC